jgi:TRAP-type transport system periplasmic protein
MQKKRSQFLLFPSIEASIKPTKKKGGAKMRNWILTVLVVCVFVLGFTCFSPSAFGQAKPIEITYSTHMPAQHSMTVLSNEWAKEIEKRTNGRVKVTVFAGGTLMGADKVYDGVAKGIADVGWVVLGATRGRFPLTEVLDLPLGYKNAVAASKMANEYYNKFKPKEFDESQVMYLHAHGPIVLHSKKPVNKLEDIKGLKIRSISLSAKIAAALGGTPVGMPVNEAYDALSRGVVDASLSPFEALKGFRWAEVTKYSIELTGSASSQGFAVVMNKRKWNALPPDTQKIIEKINEEFIEKQGKQWDAIDVEGKDFALKLGNKVSALSKEEGEKVAKAVRPLLTDYVQNMKKLGLPGDEALKFCTDRLRALQ